MKMLTLEDRRELERIREVFREDFPGKKIGVGQGNVSKLVSFASSQLPRADTLFRIAEEYSA